MHAHLWQQVVDVWAATAGRARVEALANAPTACFTKHLRACMIGAWLRRS